MVSFISRGRLAALAVAGAAALAGPVAAAEDPDEAELLKSFEKVDVWHFPVDTTVRYNDQDAVATRELVFKGEQPQGDLCYIRFDLVRGEGDYGYGFQPSVSPAERKNTVWGSNVLKRGTVLDQYYSALRLNVIYFFVDGPKSPTAKEVCQKKQSAPTAQAGNAYRGPWAELVTKVRAIHGWPAKK
ncbi:hypothetical protein WOC76_09265 [Methylocystis sp. IM3]|uniref:hypothetical protein n=1 Tax=unclassified Methylocystis TaxID=2625913 RepID=UPI0030F51637